MKQINQLIIEVRKRFIESSKQKTSTIEEADGYIVLGKSKTGISMRQMYLEEKGLWFEDERNKLIK